MDWYLYPAVIAAGFACGFVNTLAGSGSLITLPLLIFLGLPANVANGTNRVGVLIQNLVAVDSFRRQAVLPVRGGLLLAVPATAGALLGAQIAVNLDEQMMRRTIGALMVAMLIVMLVRPQSWVQGRTEAVRHRPDWLQLLLFFAIGVYGGFIQAGVGIFLLAGLVLNVGYDLVRANAIKVLIIFCFTLFALIVFVLNDQVLWGLGLLLAAGNGLGGWLAARIAVERGAVFVRWFVIGVVVISAAELLGLFDLLAGLFSTSG